jgi:hypothetical protein
MARIAVQRVRPHLPPTCRCPNPVIHAERTLHWFRAPLLVWRLGISALMLGGGCYTRHSFSTSDAGDAGSPDGNGSIEPLEARYTGIDEFTAQWGNFQDATQLGDGIALLAETAAWGAGGSDALVVATGPNGDLLWDITLGGTEDERVRALANTHDGALLVAGGTKSFPDSQGRENGWIVRLNIDGNIKWQVSLGTDNFDWLNAIVQTPDNGFLGGGYTIDGAWAVKIDSNGSPIWSKQYSSNRVIATVIPTSQDTYILAGDVGANAWIAEVDVNGEIIRETAVGVPNGLNHTFLKANQTASGYAVAGTVLVDFGSYSNHQAWFVKLSGELTVEADTIYRSEGSGRLNDLITLSDDRLLAIGNISGACLLWIDTDADLIRYRELNFSGNFFRQRLFSRSNNHVLIADNHYQDLPDTIQYGLLISEFGVEIPPQQLWCTATSEVSDVVKVRNTATNSTVTTTVQSLSLESTPISLTVTRDNLTATQSCN